MKTIITRSTIMLVLIIALISCNKPTITTTACNININLIKDIVWNPPIADTAFLAKLLFTSSGQYWQNSNNQGTWTLSNGCDSIYVVRPANTNFYSRIVSVTSDTLKITNPVFGELIYYK